MPAVLWVLAVGSYWTFAHRMYHTWRELSQAKIELEQDTQASFSSPNSGPERRTEQTLVQKAG
jgi:hypothetical protein